MTHNFARRREISTLADVADRLAALYDQTFDSGDAGRHRISAKLDRQMAGLSLYEDDLRERSVRHRKRTVHRVKIGKPGTIAMNPNVQATSRLPKSEIGWREWIGLPDLGIAALKSKVDTGARTSALHATDLQTFTQAGEPWISFRVPLANLPPDKRCTARIIDERMIKNTSGNPERRFIVETTLVLGARAWNIEVSLANRERMEFEIILGRTAIRRRRLLVNPGRSFLAGPPSGPPSTLAPSSGTIATLP